MTPKTRHLIRQLREEGMTLERIGRAFGITSVRVGQVLRYNPKARPYLTDEEKEERQKQWDRNHYRRKCGLPTVPATVTAENGFRILKGCVQVDRPGRYSRATIEQWLTLLTD